MLLLLIAWIIRSKQLSLGYLGQHLAIAGMGYYVPLITNLFLYCTPFPRAKYMRGLLDWFGQGRAALMGVIVMLLALAGGVALFIVAIRDGRRSDEERDPARGVRLEYNASAAGTVLFMSAFLIFWDGAF